MKKWLNRFLNDERGNVFVLVALLLVVLIGFTALVVDGGRLYVEKSMLQKAADAAALAGVQELPIDKAKAETKSKEVASKNDVTNTTVEIPTDNMSIRVTTSSDVNLTFARIFGKDNASVKATAKVKLNPITSVTGVIPIGIDMNAYDKWKNCTEITLKLKNPGNSGNNENKYCNGSNNLGSGNTGLIQFINSGKQDLDDEIANGVPVPVSVGEIYDTGPGGGTGKTRDGVKERVDSCSKIYTYNSATFLTNPPPRNCAQVVTVPMYSNFEDKNGRKEIKIEGFATFFLIGSRGNGGEVIGRFMDFAISGDSSAGQTNYGAYGYKLVE